MKVTDFARALSHYFGDYLINDMGCSPRTVDTYRYAFLQFIDYMEDVRKVKAQDITLDDVNNNTIYAFLKWLENERKVSVSTRNQRLAAFKSFAGFLKRDRPDQIDKFVMISNLKPKATLQKKYHTSSQRG